MQQGDYKGDRPVATTKSDGEWGIEWRRPQEGRLIQEFFSGRGDLPAVAFLENFGSTSTGAIAEDIATYSGRTLISTSIYYYSTGYFYCLLAGLNLESTGILLPSIGAEILKYTPNGNAVIFARSPLMRSMSNLIRRRIKAGDPISLGSLAEHFDVTLSDRESETIVFDEKTISDRSSADLYDSLFFSDLSKIEGQLPIVKDYIFKLDGMHAVSEAAYWKNIVGNIKDARIIVSNRAFSSKIRPSSTKVDDLLMVIGSPLLTISEVKDVLRPIWSNTDHGFIEGIADNLIESAKGYPRVADSRTRGYSEDDLERAAISISRLIRDRADDVPDSDILPRPALVDAAVYGDRLELLGTDIVESSSSVEDLDVIRELHLADVQRLRKQLTGSNAGPGFVHRIEAIERALEQPLTNASSLIVATHVRALEDMMPAVQDMIADITVADVGATIAGLGLYSRQFPAWVRFLKSAGRDSLTEFLEMRDNLGPALDELEESLSAQADEVVDPNLKNALKEVRDAAEHSTDDVINFGRLRALGNAYRAIARYLKARRDGSVAKFNEELDAVVGQQASRLVIAGTIFAATVPLLKMASLMPNEFGWFLGIYAMLNLSKN